MEVEKQDFLGDVNRGETKIDSNSLSGMGNLENNVKLGAEKSRKKIIKSTQYPFPRASPGFESKLA